MKLKPLDQQVIVITGASSGIGLATALSAAKGGAKLVLAARSETTLEQIAAQISAQGGQAIAVRADVSKRAEVEEVARRALEQYGRVDTWVNDAGVSIYGRLDAVSDEDSHQLFATNFWGVVYGSLVALPLLKKQGGALINLGSEASQEALPLQGMYAASKHAIKGFTDTLRLELEEDGAPVSVTLIQPTAVNTPYPEHAANYLAQAPKLPTPMIDPHKVASAILDAATDPARDVKVGAMSSINTLVAQLIPSLGDMMSKMQMGKQQRAEPPRSREGTLYHAGEGGQIMGRGNSNAEDSSKAKESNRRPSAG
jgi:NADP-dependent 3-hydroxy acid dehydrogenase YdfG